MAFPWAVQVARIRGIPIRLHVTFLAVLPIFAFAMAQSWFTKGDRIPDAPALVLGAMLAIVLFACVTLHELSHSLVAQRYGIRVRSITLLPIGGVSQMEEMPKDPRRELRVSAAGPLTNFALALPLGAAWWYLKALPSASPAAVQFLEAALYLNLALGAFNLLVPAFPMDGGRVLRSFLARRMPFPKATHYAATVGRAVAVGMGLLGFLDLTGGGFWLLLIAFFIYMGASEEERAVQVQATLGDLRVRDVMTPPVPLRPDMSLEDALGMMVRTRQLAFPVVEEGGRVLGFLGLQELNSFERGNYWMTPVRLAMRVQVPSIAPDALATEALRRLSGEDDHLLVLRDGQLEGIVSKADVGRLVAILGVQRGAPQRLSW